MVMVDPKGIGAHIRMRIPLLTPLEQRVLDRVMARASLSDQTSIKEVASENEVSEAMLVKLAKKLDFAGFRELRGALVRYREASPALSDEISPDDDMERLVGKVFDNAISSLEETKAILDMAVLKRAVDLLAGAGHLLLYGVGGSAVIAEDLAHKLLRIGIASQVFSDSHLMLMSASLCNDSCVVLAISHSGRTSDVCDAAALARRHGARLIVLTSYALSPLAQQADVILSSTSRSSPLLGENAGSRLAQLSILDVLYVALAQRGLSRAEEKLERTREAVERKRVR